MRMLETPRHDVGDVEIAGGVGGDALRGAGGHRGERAADGADGRAGRSGVEDDDGIGDVLAGIDDVEVVIRIDRGCGGVDECGGAAAGDVVGGCYGAIGGGGEDRYAIVCFRQSEVASGVDGEGVGRADLCGGVEGDAAGGLRVVGGVDGKLKDRGAGGAFGRGGVDVAGAVDCLALGMMSCMKRGLDLLRDYKGLPLDLATIPAEDWKTYRMIQRADTLGVFQIESRAQMAMLPRIKPQTFYDLVIEVAIVRPGPIQGDMVHPYLRRREGKEPVDYPTPELERVLGKTLGVPLFQEQAMRVAIECAGFTAGEADQLRRAMATFKFTGGVSHFKDKLVGGMIARGYTPEFADKTFSQLEGFGSYGFPESHAASFALIAYASSWLKCHHPDVFCTALLNAQPMGFYAPAQIVRDAREHGVEVRPICVNASRWDCTLEPAHREGRYAVRLGLRMVRRLGNADGAKLVLARGEEPFRSLPELWRRAKLPRSALDRLAEADAFRPALKLARREALWTIKGLRDTPMPLFDLGEDSTELNESAMDLKPMTEGREVVEDYGTVGLSLRAHPVSFLRPELKVAGIVTCEDIGRARDGRTLKVAGLVLVRQRPGSAKGVMFITIEDETGVANLVIWEKVFEKHRRTVLTGSMLKIDGRVQREGEVVHLIAYRLEDLTPMLSDLGQRQAPFALPHGRGDEGARTPRGPDPRGPRPARDIYIPDLHIDTLKQKARDFR